METVPTHNAPTFKKTSIKDEIEMQKENLLMAVQLGVITWPQFFERWNNLPEECPMTASALRRKYIDILTRLESAYDDEKVALIALLNDIKEKLQELVQNN